MPRSMEKSSWVWWASQSSPAFLPSWFPISTSFWLFWGSAQPQEGARPSPPVLHTSSQSCSSTDPCSLCFQGQVPPTPWRESKWLPCSTRCSTHCSNLSSIAWETKMPKQPSGKQHRLSGHGDRWMLSFCRMLSLHFPYYWLIDMFVNNTI